MVFILWLLFSIIVGLIGNERKIGFIGGFIISIILSPLIGLIIVLISDKIDKNLQKKNNLLALSYRKSKNKKYEESIKILQEALLIDNNDPIIHFNLSCFYSILNKINFSFNHLKKSIELGYSNYEKINNDKDLENLRKDKQFIQFKNNNYI